jgi:hypothetical protein
VALVISVLLIRRPLLSTIPFLRKLKYSDVEIEFGQEISSLRKSVSEIKVKSTSLLIPDTRIPEHILKIASISPRAAVLEAWKEVEIAINELAQRTPELIKNMSNNTISDLVDTLEKNGHLDRDYADFFRRQKALNERFEYRAKGTEFNPDEAMELIDVHIGLASMVRRA